MERNLKLFVWDGVLIDYTAGMMFAVAESVEEARALLLKRCPHIPVSDLNQEPNVHDLISPVAYFVWGGG